MFAAFIRAVVRTLAVSPGTFARSPSLAHVHAVVGHTLLRHGPFIHRAQDYGHIQSKAPILVAKAAASKSEITF